MYDLNTTTKYTVWAVRATGPDVVYASSLSQWDADLVCNEMNSVDDTADYRVTAELSTPKALWAIQVVLYPKSVVASKAVCEMIAGRHLPTPDVSGGIWYVVDTGTQLEAGYRFGVEPEEYLSF